MNLKKYMDGLSNQHDNVVFWLFYAWPMPIQTEVKNRGHHFAGRLDTIEGWLKSEMGRTNRQNP